MTPTPRLDVGIKKTHHGSFVAGDVNTYSLTVTNTGNTVASGPFVVTDSMPPGLTVISVTPPEWNCIVSGGTDVSCTHAGPLQPGDSLPAITITVDVGTKKGGTVNTAFVSMNGDGDPANNSSSDAVLVGIGPAPAPLLSPAGVLAAIALLLGVGGWGLFRRRAWDVLRPRQGRRP